MGEGDIEEHTGEGAYTFKHTKSLFIVVACAFSPPPPLKEGKILREMLERCDHVGSLGKIVGFPFGK